MTTGILNPTTGRFVDMVSPVNRLCPLNRGLGAWWLGLPGTTGGARLMDVMNLGPHGHHGTLTNMDPATDWKSSDRLGGFVALDYDGTNDFVDVPDHPDLKPASALTIMAWIRIPGTTPSFSAIIEKARSAPSASEANGYVLTVNALNQLRLDLTGTAATGTTLLETDEWWHVAGWWDGADIKVFVNAVEEASIAKTSITYNTGNLNIGRDKFSPTGRVFNGLIDDVRIFNRALTVAELEYVISDSQKGYPDTLNWIEEPAVTFVEPAGGTTSPWYQYQQQLAGAV